jgi:actin related protein 2/3 complex subunit 2
LDQTFSDFGESRFHLWEDEQDTSSILLSSSFPGFKNLTKLGLEKHLTQHLSCGAKFTDAEKGYDFTLRIPKDNINGNSSVTQFILDDGVKQLSMLRRTCLALPLEMAIAEQESGRTSEIMVIPLRSTDLMYIQGCPDRVTVVLATKFEDPSDIVLGKVFLQEFYDVRKQNNMQNAPAVLFGKEPPKEMKSSIPTDPSLNYITFGTTAALY